MDSVAVADDFLFMSNYPDELQTVFSISTGYAGERRYKIHPTTTTLMSKITTRASRDNDNGKKWYMGGKRSDRKL